MSFRNAARWPAVLGFTLFVGLLVVPSLRADDFHLKGGGAVSGDLLEATDTGYRVRTAVGSVTLPKTAVERIEQTESPFKEYDRRLAETPDTADGWVDFAHWCEDNGFASQAPTHLRHALELDPNHEAARKALGFVRVGGLWVEGRSVTETPEPEATPTSQSANSEELARAIQSQWRRQISAIRNNMLDSSIDRIVQEGRKRILEIKDPLAILPLAKVLSAGKLNSRSVLVDALATFPQDESTLNLAVLTLLESDPEVLHRAISVLVQRRDPRVVAQFREALKATSSDVVGNAAQALGAIGDRSAIPELIDALHVDRRKTVEVPVTQGYFRQYTTCFNTRTEVSFGDSRISVSPSIGIDRQVWLGHEFTHNQFVKAQVTEYRTEVLEALKAITGENYGFDSDAWRRWYDEGSK